jgi:hypothetical protein
MEVEEWEEGGLDPNSAELEDLIQLPGVGRVLAERIIAHRPYDIIDSLRRVPGLGGVTLLRIEPYLSIEEGEAFEVPESTLEEPARPEEEQEVRQEEIEEVEPGPAERALPSRPLEITRNRMLWMLAGTFVLSVVAAVGLSLAILVGINRTLNVGQHAAVRRAGEGVSQIQVDLESLSSRMEAISKRMEAIEGLSGRVAAMERDFASLETDVEEAMQEMDDIRARTERVAGDVQDMREKVDLFHRFLLELESLLSDLSLPGAEATPQP